MGAAARGRQNSDCVARRSDCSRCFWNSPIATRRDFLAADSFELAHHPGGRIDGELMGPLDPQGFAALSGVSRETLARLEIYAGLLVRWSARINLVGANTIDDLWRRHFLDSAQLTAHVPEGTQSLIDLGSGAGFPGLVLAISGVPEVELIEADARKCAFLREAARIAAAARLADSMATLTPEEKTGSINRAASPTSTQPAPAMRFMM